MAPHQLTTPPADNVHPPRQRLLVCYGASLALQSIVQLLADLPDTLLVHCDPALPGSSTHLQELHPDLILVDLTALAASEVLALLHRQPGVPLLGLDLRHHEMLLLQSYCRATPSLPDFVELVRAISDGVFEHLMTWGQ